MPFSVKHLFLPDDPMIARKFQENFDNIVSELNSFPISGAFKPGSIATTNITDDNITAAKFSSNLQFDQIPKGPAATDPSHADHLTRKSYAVTALSALITSPATKHIDHGDANLIGGGLVGIPVTSHAFVKGTYCTISNTTNYNNTYLVHSTTTANEVVIVATNNAEHFEASTSHIINQGAGATSLTPFSSSTASLEEYEYFFNEFRWIYGYCKASDLYKTTALTTRVAVASDSEGYIKLTAELAKMFHVMVVPIVGTATYQRVSVMPSTYATTGYIHIKSGVGGAGQTGSALVLSNFYGFFYMIVGRDI
jgi:hypothetical protein